MSGLHLSTARLGIRPFTDADTPQIDRILRLCFGDGDASAEGLERRRSWVRWQALNDEWFARMFQPMYGDRAVVLARTGELIGSVGYVALVGPFDQFPALRRHPVLGGGIPEFGLFWAIDPAHQGRGYASEAARAMIGHALGALQLGRVIALTSYDNAASAAVMRAAGMTVHRNPLPDPPWLQVVGVAHAGVWPGADAGPRRVTDPDQRTP